MPPLLISVFDFDNVGDIPNTYPDYVFVQDAPTINIKVLINVFDNEPVNDTKYYGLQFNEGYPTGNATIGNIPSLQLAPGGQFTIECYINVFTYFQPWSVFTDQFDFSANKGYVMQINSSGFLTLFYGNSNVVSSSPVPLNTPTYISISYDGTNLHMHINGTNVYNAAFAGLAGSTTGQSFLGNESATSGNRSGDGLVSEFRFSKTGRYNGSGYTPPTTRFTTDANTLILYHFDEGPGGGMVDDSSGNHFDATINNSFTTFPLYEPSIFPSSGAQINTLSINVFDNAVPWDFRQNLITNPSFEVNNSYWGAGSFGNTSGLTFNLQDNSHALYGTYSASFGTQAADAGAYYLTNNIPFIPVNGQTYTLSAYVFILSSSNISTINIAIRDFVSFSNLAVTTAPLVTNQWTRVSVSVTASTASQSWRFSVADAISSTQDTFWVDGVMLEISGPSTNPTPYFDGSFANYQWDGTANNSISETSRDLAFINSRVIQVSDSETVTENVNLVVVDRINVFDAETVTDAVRFFKPIAEGIGALAIGVGHNVVRTSGGTLYSVINNAGTIQVYKSSNGTSWANQDAAHSPAAKVTYVAEAIDSGGTIHLTYVQTGTTNNIFHVTYVTSTDLFGTPESAISGTSSNALNAIDIAIDSNDIPHIAAARSTVASSQWTYANRVGGAWNASVGTTITNGASSVAILIDNSNLPQVAVYELINAVSASIGNVNNATSFTRTSLAASGAISNAQVSISMDSGNNTWLSYTDNNHNVTLIEHVSGNSWATWQAAVTDSKTGDSTSLAVNGTDVYVFYKRHADGTIAYDKYNGSWAGEVLLIGASAGYTYANARAKWSQYDNNQGSTQIDFLFDDGTTTYWSDLVLGVTNDSINVFDSESVTESVNIQLVDIVNVFDSDSATDVPTVIEVDIINVNDTDSDTDSPTIRQVYIINVFESESATDVLPGTPPLIVTLPVSVFDTDSITENTNVNEVDTVNVFDSESVTESVSLAVVTTINVFDSDSVTDVPTVIEVDIINVNEVESVTDVLPGTPPLIITLPVSVNDTDSDTDSPVIIEVDIVNVNDIESVTESVTLAVITTINVFDSESVTDVLPGTPPLIIKLPVSVFDTESVTENIQLQVVSFINVNDTESVSENVNVNEVDIINVNDSESVSESVTVNEISFINVNDTESVTESVTVTVTNPPPLLITRVSPVNLSVGSNGSGSFTSATTASISPASNNLILLAVASRTGITTDPNAPTVTGDSLTWVQVATVVYDNTSSSRRRLTVFRALGSPSSGALTIDFGGQTQTDAVWTIDQFANTDLSGTNGSGAVVQSNTNFDPTDPPVVTGLTVTLGAFSNIANATYGAFAISFSYDPPNPGSGFTILGHTQVNANVEVASEWNVANSTSVSVDYGAGNTVIIGGIAIEISTSLVFDSATATEAVTMLVKDFINVNDVESVTESINVNEVDIINVNDTDSDTDAVTKISVPLPVSVFDSESVTDVLPGTPPLIVTLPINVNDTESVTESVTIAIISTGSVTFSVFDSATATDVPFINRFQINVSDVGKPYDWRQNLVTNPSFESAGTFWSTGGNAGNTTGLTHSDQDTTHVLYGSFAAMLQTAGSTGQFYLTSTGMFLPVIGQTYTFSAYVFIPTGSPITSIVTGIRDWNSFTYLTFITTNLVQNQWTRISTTYTATTANQEWRITIADPQGASSGSIGTYWVDGTMLEVSGPSTNPTSYFDGSFANYQWDGSANASTSSTSLDLPFINGRVIQVSESEAITESVTIAIQQVASITLSIFDTVSDTDLPNVVIVDLLSVNDTESVTDVVSKQVVTLPINVSETEAVTESTAFNLGTETISVFETEAITEGPVYYVDTVYPTDVFIGLNIPLPVSVFDTESVTDVVTFEEEISFINVFDSDSATENVKIVEVDIVNVFDSDSATDVIPGTPPLIIKLPVSVFETESTTENTNVNEVDIINVFDSESITENVVVNIVSTTSLSFSVFDSESVTDVLPGTPPLIIKLPVSVFDSESVTDVVIFTEEIDDISVFDFVSPSGVLELINTPLYSSSSLISYWNFDAGSSVDNKDGNNGSDTNMVYGNPYGFFGQGANLDGTAVSLVTDTGLPSGNSDRSVVAWVNLQALNNNGGDIFFYGTNQPESCFEAFVGQNGIAAHIGIRTGNGGVPDTGFGGVVSQNTWHHVAWVYTSSNSTCTFYIDGINAGSVVLAPLTTTLSGNGQIGNGALGHFTGYLDDLAIFSRALSSTEVNQIANGGWGVLDVATIEVINRVSVFEAETVTENVQIELIDQGLNVFDTEVVTESLQIKVVLLINVNDSEVVTDSSPLIVVTCKISVFDSESVSESITLGIVQITTVGTFVIMNTYFPNYIIKLYQTSYIVEVTDSDVTNFTIRY